jgi:sugar lactone lactonase YvrE
VVTTFAGSTQGYLDGTGTAAKFDRPYGITVDGSGNLYVADTDNHRIRKIDIATGVVTTLAGSTQGYADGAGTAAQFSAPSGIAAVGSGNLYVADAGNHRIRKIVIDTREVTTLAGSSQGFANGTGTAAQFFNPFGIATDGGNLYVTDRNNHRIRKIVIDTGVVTTFAGSTQGYADGTSPAAKFFAPSGIAIDGSGNLYVADLSNHRIRKIVIATLEVTTLAGSSQGFADGTGTAAKFYNPYGVAADGSGNLYVAEIGNHRIRKITQ